MSACKKSAWKVSRTGFLCAVALMALPVLASAKPKVENTPVQRKNIQLDQPATVDGKTLAPGQYKVVIEGDKASFERDGRTILTARCDWRTMRNKAPYNSASFSANHALQELEFEGSNQALDIL